MLTYILARFEKASGQRINLEKTEVNFSKGTSNQVKDEIRQILGITQSSECNKYLGLPTRVRRSKKEIFKAIKGKLEKRLKGWSNFYLSKAGREVLIKSVAQAIPSYALSVFKMPDNSAADFQSLIFGLWWGRRNSERKIHWKNWDSLCRPKNSGGLGFRDLQVFNDALLGKQGWRLLSNPDTLAARVLKARYFPTTSFLQAELGKQPSYVWRSIWQAKRVVEKGMAWQVGFESDMNVWSTPWIFDNAGKKAISKPPPGMENLRVSELNHHSTRSWNYELVDQIFLPFEADRIKQMAIGSEQGGDRAVWWPEKTGNYTVKSAHHLICNEKGETCLASSSTPNTKLWSSIWEANVTPRVKVHAWSVCNEALPTNARLAVRINGRSDICPGCALEPESDLHALRDCNYNKKVWHSLGIDIDFGTKRIVDWVQGTIHSLTKPEFDLFLICLWSLWKRRNELVFEGQFKTNEMVVESCV